MASKREQEQGTKPPTKQGGCDQGPRASTEKRETTKSS